MTQNEYVYAISCRLEVGDDVISGEIVKTIDGYALLNFEVASLSIFRNIKKSHFEAAEATDIDDSIKRKRIRVSLKRLTRKTQKLWVADLPDKFF